jgi:hypothetical protein
MPSEALQLNLRLLVWVSPFVRSDYFDLNACSFNDLQSLLDEQNSEGSRRRASILPVVIRSRLIGVRMRTPPSALPVWTEELPFSTLPWVKCSPRIRQLAIRLAPTAYMIMTHLLSKAGQVSAAFEPGYEPGLVEVDVDLFEFQGHPQVRPPDPIRHVGSRPPETGHRPGTPEEGTEGDRPRHGRQEPRGRKN